MNGALLARLFALHLIDLRGATTFHLSLLWVAVGLLMFGVALALVLAWSK